jgi:hypothetical protein
MSELLSKQSEIQPVNPELFARVAKVLMRVGLEHGTPAPAQAYSEEDRQLDESYNIDPPSPLYSVWPSTHEYMQERGLRNDSKIVTGILACDTAEGHRIATVVLLGEGPSIQFGEVGHVTTQDDQLHDINTYRLKNDGRITMDQATPLPTDEMVSRWQPTRSATDDELALLAQGLESFRPDNVVLFGMRTVER